jgi:hypothetical protein
VPELADAKHREREQQARHERRRGPAGQLPDKQVGAKAGEHERRQEHEVVAEDEIAGHRVDRHRLQRLR